MKKTRLLLVDDEQEFVMTLAERLEIRNYEVRVAQDGEKALTSFTSEAFDLVILDLMMPGMNGLEVLTRLKAIEPKIPVLLLTGHGSRKEGMEGKRLGAFDYLMKPLQIDELIARIREALPR